MKVLQINEASSLSKTLSKLKNFQIKSFPEINMENIKLIDNYNHLVIHSDTLEHIPNPLKGLKECRRILKIGGVLIFTIPIIYQRLNKSRLNMKNSYHGSSEDSSKSDYKVYTEYGADFWVEIISSGFKSCEIFSLNFPSGLAIIAKK